MRHARAGRHLTDLDPRPTDLDPVYRVQLHDELDALGEMLLHAFGDATRNEAENVGVERVVRQVCHQGGRADRSARVHAQQLRTQDTARFDSI